MAVRSKSKSLPWDTVEKAIAEEIKWLKETIKLPYVEDEKVCKNCIYIKMANETYILK